MSDTTDTAGVVRAKRLEIVDDEGRVRAVVGEVGRQAFGVSLFDAGGGRRAELSVGVDDYDETESVLLFDRDGDCAVVLRGGQHDAYLVIDSPGSGAEAIDLTVAESQRLNEQLEAVWEPPATARISSPLDRGFRPGSGRALRTSRGTFSGRIESSSVVNSRRPSPRRPTLASRQSR
jgi:hypothetical protein